MRAIISVSDKRDVDRLAKELSNLGLEIIATGGTAKVLKEAGVKILEVSEFTGSEGTRLVKTLHPKIFKGILENSDSRIDLVIVNLYSDEEDIGGVSLIRASLKAGKPCVVSPDDYERVVKELKEGGISPSLLAELEFKARVHVLKHIVEKLPEGVLVLTLRKARELRYGTNPGDQASFFTFLDDKPKFEVLKEGHSLSLNNLYDADTAISLALELKKACVIVKHGSPSSVALSSTSKEALKRAWESDPVSAFGSTIGFSQKVESVKYLLDKFVEVVVAPEFSEQALKDLSTKKNLRVLRLKEKPKSSISLKAVLGGFAVEIQEDKEEEWRTVTKVQTQNLDELKFAWKVVKYVRSNAIVLAKDLRTVGVAGGFTSRIDAVKFALEKAGNEAKGAVLASDGFFPFRDSIDVIAEAGVKAVIQPGGSVRDKEIIEAADEHKISMIFTGRRCFRH